MEATKWLMPYYHNEEGAAGEHQDENLLPGFHWVGSNRVESLAFCAIVVFWGPLLCDMQARIRA